MTPDLSCSQAILTVLTSPHVRVQEGTLLRAVRTCYDIHLESRIPVCQTAAKVTLTQVRPIPAAD